MSIDRIDPTLEEAEEYLDLNEAADLRAEDRKAAQDVRFAEMDRRDQSGPHYPYRS